MRLRRILLLICTLIVPVAFPGSTCARVRGRPSRADSPTDLPGGRGDGCRLPRPHRLRARYHRQPRRGRHRRRRHLPGHGPHTFTVIADIGAWLRWHTRRSRPSSSRPTSSRWSLTRAASGHRRPPQPRAACDARRSDLGAGRLPRHRADRHHAPGPHSILHRSRPLCPTRPLTQRRSRSTHAQGTTRVLASGAPLLVDVKLADCSMYALSQGHFTPGHAEGSPADPNTGALERVSRHGTMTPIATGLDRPASMQIIGHTAIHREPCRRGMDDPHALLRRLKREQDMRLPRCATDWPQPVDARGNADA